MHILIQIAGIFITLFCASKLILSIIEISPHLRIHGLKDSFKGFISSLDPTSAGIFYTQLFGILAGILMIIWGTFL